jgi:hypothetical protein
MKIEPPATEPPTDDRDARSVHSDEQLNSFIRGEIPLIMDDGAEHWFDLDGGRSYTLNEISLVMGVTRERVRQIQQKALRKMYARLASMARVEGENPVEWFGNVFKALDELNEGGVEYEA